MISQNRSVQTENQDSNLHLFNLGWSPFFQKQLGDKDVASSPARVTGVRKNCFLVSHGNGELLVTMAGSLINDPAVCYPAVGDWVLLRDSIIISILSRRNVLIRKSSGGKNRKNGEVSIQDQIIAANLDMVFIVCGLDRDFNLRRIERYLTLVYNCGLSPVIILTKSDLCTDPEKCVSDVEAITYGVPVYLVSLYDNMCLDEIASLLRPHKTAALIGSSGAGKSTLLNRMAGEEVHTTGAVGSRVGKGRHTTTTRDMVLLLSGGMVIDNPGIREIGIAVGGERSIETFPDIEAFSQLCRFKDCSHVHEPGCRVLQAVSDGEVPADRFKNYHKLKNELSYTHQRQNKSSSRIEKERWKSVSQKARSIKKRREEWK